LQGFTKGEREREREESWECQLQKAKIDCVEDTITTKITENGEVFIRN
jgi:hypothetical protein